MHNTPLVLPNIHQFPQDEVAFIAPSWDELHALTFGIAQKIREHHYDFDRVVTLAKGGWPMSRSLADFLEISQVQSLGISFYKGIDEREAKPMVYQELPVDITGERVLLFDDVADTGESLAFVLQYLKEKGATSITTATVFYKERSQVTPDFFAAQVAEWIVFPYELVETLQLVGNRWLSEGISPEEVVQRFIKLQFAESQVRYFMQSVLLAE